MKRSLPLPLLSCCGLLLLAACGPSRTAPRSARPAADPVTPAPEKKAPQWDGPTVALGQEFAIVGWNAVGVRGADMVVYLRATDWTELVLEGEAVREGTAQLTVMTAEGDRKLDVDIGETAVVGDYAIECRDAADGVDEHGRTVPTVKLLVRRHKP